MLKGNCGDGVKSAIFQFLRVVPISVVVLSVGDHRKLVVKHASLLKTYILRTSVFPNSLVLGLTHLSEPKGIILPS